MKQSSFFPRKLFTVDTNKLQQVTHAGKDSVAREGHVLIQIVMSIIIFLLQISLITGQTLSCQSAGQPVKQKAGWPNQVAKQD
mmetsp:Transcript_34906/g.74463  ORF Transcript_34906/g.74463 Transcript_34906/m.74463 type:complete len:83 (-) Transcript_34906:719-967(-)